MRNFLPLTCLMAAASAMPAFQARNTTTNATSSAAQHHTTSVASCEGNHADDRARWCNDSIDTDWYNYVPNTGVTREVGF